ncbi:hypothetical protein FACS189431_2390 [Alphaproteobacteria bacterium]|nr:hypothetical protein FACS189431_2390 [Alphaproteobacteria bacterium]
MRHFIDFIKQHKLATIAVTFVLLIIIASIFALLSPKPTDPDNLYTDEPIAYELDPASQEMIATSGNIQSELIWVGFSKMRGCSKVCLEEAGTAILAFAKDKDIKLTRVSLFSDGNHDRSTGRGQDAVLISDFRIMLNRDELEVGVSITMPFSGPIIYDFYSTDGTKLYTWQSNS